MTIGNSRRLIRFLLLLFPAIMLSGCVVVPRIDVTEEIHFNYQPYAAVAPMSYDDAMCCYDCQA